MQIKKTTLVNGQDIDSIDDDTILTLIAQEQASIASLESLNLKSEAVEKRIAKHNGHIAQLVELMDSRSSAE